jgi:hypothetical protein
MNRFTSGRTAIKFLLLPVFGATLAGRGTTAPVQSAAPKLPPSGRITYSMRNSMVSGSMALAWLQGGKKMRQDINMKLPQRAPRGTPSGKPASITGWTIYDGTHVYSYMPTMAMGAGKRVMRMKLSPEMSRRMMMGALNSVGAQAGGGKMVGKGTVLGKPCVIREAVMNTNQMKSRTRMWMWQGLPLRVDSTMQVTGMQPGAAPNAGTSQTRTIKTTLAATKIDTSTSPSPALFKVPAGYQVQDMKMPASMGRPR